MIPSRYDYFQDDTDADSSYHHYLSRIGIASRLIRLTVLPLQQSHFGHKTRTEGHHQAEVLS